MPENVYIKKEFIEEALSTPPSQGKKMLEPLKSFAKENHVPLNIVEDMQVTTNEAEVHMHEGDLWHCIEGSVDFTYGGELVEPYHKKSADGKINENEIKGKSIKGGTAITMKVGDWLWVPAGQPHMHNTAGMARLIIIKIPC